MIPSATYRIQFHKGFTFADGAALAPYLAGLGISHLYASPIATARAGSVHGYDQIDPTTINPELGGEDGFRAMAAELKAHGIGLIVDIVPNHMAVGYADNRWWLDVVANGPTSAYAQMFDIDWAPADVTLRGRLLAPFLGEFYAEALQNGDIVLKRDPQTGRLAAWAHDAHCLPLRPADQEIAPDEAALAAFDPKTPEGRARLHEVLERQHFQFALWRTAGDAINWRRFFEIIELAGVRVEDEAVFELMHALPLRLYSEGLIDGVRVDHVDGLTDPGAYCRRLRRALEAAGRDRPPEAGQGAPYLVVEKILGEGEILPPEWECDGTTGYDWMDLSGGLLHDPAGADALTELWTRVSGRPASFGEEELSARRAMLDRAFAGQLDTTVDAFHALARSELATRDIPAQALRRALGALLCAFPVYRTYATGAGGSREDRRWLDEALEHALPNMTPKDDVVARQAVEWLAGGGPGAPALKAEALRRFEQLSAPLSAKSVEDTAFYRYGRLTSRCEVGSCPGRLAFSVEETHAANAARADALPHAMLAGATHDHKHGEDARARLAVVSEIPSRWAERVARWDALNAGKAQGLDPGDVYRLYQALVGSWPLDLEPTDGDGLAAYSVRIVRRQNKALREAKLRSSWNNPDTVYETAADAFVNAVLDPAQSAPFLADLHGFVQEIAPAGALNGLAQALMRCTAPGMPDLYQGREGWDFSLVDPDNRTPVDYEAARRALADPAPWGELLSRWRDGHVKTRLIARALDLRRRRPAVFTGGGYRPAVVSGADGHDRAIGWWREGGGGAVLMLAPLRVSRAVGAADLSLDRSALDGLTLDVPAPRRDAPARDVLTGEAVRLAARTPLADLWGSSPLALVEVGG